MAILEVLAGWLLLATIVIGLLVFILAVLYRTADGHRHVQHRHPKKVKTKRRRK